jgi:hypothetical protein
MSNETVTMAEMVYRAISYRNQMGALKATRFLPGTMLLPGLAAMQKQCDGVEWVLTAIASWCVYGESGKSERDLRFDGEGKCPGEYRWLIEHWPSLRELQYFELHRYGLRGAELCVRGGVDDFSDDSLTLHPIQRWEDAQIPWSDDDPLCVWAERLDDRWALMLPREFYDLFPSIAMC